MEELSPTACIYKDYMYVQSEDKWLMVSLPMAIAYGSIFTYYSCRRWHL